jgi:steroid delta-isomerase-like uncharacterized protein
MSTENCKAIAHRLVEEIWNQGNLSVADEIFDANFANHDDVRPEVIDLESYKQWVATGHAAFPDLCLTIEDIIAEENKIVIRYTFTGTHRGELMGISPTGKQVVMAGIDIYRIASGKIVECWVSMDDLGFLQQLGVVPPMGQGEE